MDLLKQLIDVFLHIDRHLEELTRNYGAWTNALLFVVVLDRKSVV
jgi:membrane-associated protein